jgi:glycosyltransferase involved in cell wall biosynthesis
MLRYFKYPLIRYSLLAILRRVDKVNVLSPWWSTYFMQYLAADRLAVIPNPLPQAWEQVARTALPDKEGAGGNTKLLAMSRLEPGKGVDLVVEAMAHLPGNFRLTVAGSGSLAAPLSRRARELGLSERIEFTGWVSGIDKQRLLESADLFVLPSSNDSFGMGFVEAMANGLPVVALHWGPIGDIVPNGRAGVLVENPCSVELAEAIVTLADRDTRRRMGEAGKQWVIEAFAAQKIGQRLRLEFDELILSP